MLRKLSEENEKQDLRTFKKGFQNITANLVHQNSQKLVL